MEILRVGFAEVVASIVPPSSPFSEKSTRARTTFQWGGTIFALFLLILNRTGRRSPLQTTLLALYLITSFPTVLFKILRGQFGCWVAFLAVAANLFCPQTFPVSRFLFFVITPDWLADGLRDSIVSGIFCLIIGISIAITEIGGIGCNCHFFGYCLGIAFLLFFAIQYLCSGTW
ncbi:cold-regulated 413 plasma membrane protein 1-like [Fagus crenata]